jgi:hypothetical protein
MSQYTAVLSLLILSIAAHVHCQFGTKSLPAVSCQSLLSRGAKPSSGLYWIKPKGAATAFQGYCDMDSFGGGWLMCYTTNLHVHVSREVSSTVAYGSNGYRSDCRNFPFNHVMSVSRTVFVNAFFGISFFCVTSARVGTLTTLRKSASMIDTPLCGSNSTVLALSKPAPPATEAVSTTPSHGSTGAMPAQICVALVFYRMCSSTLGPTWTPHGGANIETLECRAAKAKWGTANYIQEDVLQLCGRRTLYQLLVCDNAIESDIGAPYYSEQQLFPGFMMAEYDGEVFKDL